MNLAVIKCRCPNHDASKHVGVKGHLTYIKSKSIEIYHLSSVTGLALLANDVHSIMGVLGGMCLYRLIGWVCTCSGQFWYLQYFTIIVSFGSTN